MNNSFVNTTTIIDTKNVDSTIKNPVKILPYRVFGVLSPYPTVVRVTMENQKQFVKESNPLEYEYPRKGSWILNYLY